MATNWPKRRSDVKPDLKVLFTSGYAEPAVARLGAGAWLKKPYTAAELAGKIREILSQ